MRLDIFDTADLVAQQAAKWIAQEAIASVAARGKFVLAVSGGHTPWQMLRALATEDLPWEAVFIAQVDERVAPVGSADRNLTHLRTSLSGQKRIAAGQILAMPVDAQDLESGALEYAELLQESTSVPATLDVAHLGLGPDGHTASLVPGDPVLQVSDRDVSITGIYQGRRRMTLTYPMLNRSRKILWLATGESKQEMLGRLWKGDDAIPAGRISRQQATIFADREAAGSLPEGEFNASPSG